MPRPARMPVRPSRRWLVAAVVALVAAGVTAWLVRTPVPAAAGPAGTAGLTGENAPHTHVTGDGMAGMTGAVVPVGGTGASAGGYTMRPLVSGFVAGTPGEFRFVVTGPDGAPVTRYAVVHDKLLHLIIARHDLTGYQHLHPTLAPDGTWSIPVTFAAAGSYRAYADFTAVDAKGTQAAAVLAVDLTVTGPAVPDSPLPPPATSTTVDGLTVAYRGAPVVGTAEPFVFTVTRDGQPVALEPYLGAFGHLVVLRRGDLGYLHIHPETEPAPPAGTVKCWFAAPDPGSYRMYLDFQVGGVVHTAEYTLVVPA